MSLILMLRRTKKREKFKTKNILFHIEIFYFNMIIFQITDLMNEINYDLKLSSDKRKYQEIVC